MSSRSQPPYARIAAELRQRIETGQLAPGDRLPSTRDITRDWGVAIATATRALAALRDQGLVRPVPGVGTVVAETIAAGAAVEDALVARAAIGGTERGLRRRPAPPEPAPAMSRRRAAADTALTADRIVAAAIAIADADAEGLAGLSMRRVAADLDTAAMSLYRHVADKDDLLLQMMDATMRECRLPADPPDGWRARLELAGHTLWATFRRHPWLAPALSLTRPQPIAAGMVYTEWVLTALDGCGLDLPRMFDVNLTLFNYVRGTAVNLEPEADAEAASGLNSEEWLSAQESTMRSILADARLPLLGRLFTMEYDFDLDALFERGLQCLLDGISVALGGRAR